MRGVAILLMALAMAIRVDGARAGQPRQLTDADLRAYMASDYDKAALMNTTVTLGRYRGTALVADFPCADACPSQTVRIVHFVPPAGKRCRDVGGVTREVLVPVAITMRSEMFCMPSIVADAVASRE